MQAWSQAVSRSRKTWRPLKNLPGELVEPAISLQIIVRQMTNEPKKYSKNSMTIILKKQGRAGENLRNWVDKIVDGPNISALT